MADMIFDHTDVDGLIFDVIPLDGGGVRVRIFAAGKYTTTRVVDLPTETALDLVLAVAGHLHVERAGCTLDGLTTVEVRDA